jgi:hypothetical protein
MISTSFHLGMGCSFMQVLAVANGVDKDSFFYPTARYRGEFSPQQLAFNANLQEFASRISLICGLETGGKISSEEAYRQIKQLWKDLKQSKKELIDNSQPPPPELPPDEA